MILGQGLQGIGGLKDRPAGVVDRECLGPAEDAHDPYQVQFSDLVIRGSCVPGPLNTLGQLSVGHLDEALFGVQCIDFDAVSHVPTRLQPKRTCVDECSTQGGGIHAREFSSSEFLRNDGRPLTDIRRRSFEYLELAIHPGNDHDVDFATRRSD